MGEEANYNMSLKLLVDTKANKVLFAEAGKDFVDFLFQIMLLPIGTVTKLLKMKGDKMGSLGDLYKSIEALSSDYIQPDANKDAVLKPVSSVAGRPPNLLLLKDAPGADNSTSTRKFYGCSWSPSSHYSYVSDAPGAACPSCNNTMSYQLKYVAPKSSSASSGGAGGYVKGVVTYMVTDNLEVRPMSTISALTLFNKFHVKDVASLVEKYVEVGFEEGMAILKASLKRQAVLTTTFLEDYGLP